MVEGFTIFTDFKETEGHFGLGRVPEEIQKKTDILCKKFYNDIPKNKLQSKTYHKWFDEFSPDIKSIIESIKKNPFWNELCNKPGCTVVNISEMDELYYSKAPSKKSVIYFYTERQQTTIPILMVYSDFLVYISIAF